MLPVPRLRQDLHHHGEGILSHPGPLVDDVLDGHPDRGDELGEVSNTSRSVTDHHVEGDEPPVSRKTFVVVSYIYVREGFNKLWPVN